MKRLFLLRHAKSSWDHPGLSDERRPLNARGERDAPQMGRAISERHSTLTLHVSPATRAQQTAEGVLVGWRGNQLPICHTVDALYTFSAQRLMAWIHSQPGSMDSLVLVSHNPGLTDLINWLDPAAGLDNLPTAAWAELQLQVDLWSSVTRGCGELTFLLRPRELKALAGEASQ